MSIIKSQGRQEKDASADSWEKAISDAERLIQETEDEEKQYGLRLAVKWFQYRLESGAEYPGINRAMC
jgi:hypothetical protein